jgi:hypothetical protein
MLQGVKIMDNNIDKPKSKLLYYKNRNVIISLPKGTWDSEFAKADRKRILNMARKFNGEP